MLPKDYDWFMIFAIQDNYMKTLNLLVVHFQEQRSDTDKCPPWPHYVKSHTCQPSPPSQQWYNKRSRIKISVEFKYPQCCPEDKHGKTSMDPLRILAISSLFLLSWCHTEQSPPKLTIQELKSKKNGDDNPKQKHPSSSPVPLSHIPKGTNLASGPMDALR